MRAPKAESPRLIDACASSSFEWLNDSAQKLVLSIENHFQSFDFHKEFFQSCAAHAIISRLVWIFLVWVLKPEPGGRQQPERLHLVFTGKSGYACC